MTSYENAAKATTELLDGMISSQELPGIQYIVVDTSGIRYEYANGMADVKSQTPVTPNTWFLSASCTKTVTAAAILKLYEQGKLELDDPLSPVTFPDNFWPEVFYTRVDAEMPINTFIDPV